MKRLFPLFLTLAATSRAAGGSGVEFSAVFPDDLSAPQPLVATGSAGRGDLVLLGRDGDRNLRFGWDHSGEGVLWWNPVPETKSGSHLIQVILENLGPPADGAHAGSVAVLLDGEVAYLADGDLWPATATDPKIGANASGLPAAGRQLFSGTISQVRRFDPVGEQITWRQIFRWDRLYPEAGHLRAGAVRLHLTLPTRRIGRAEPLLVAGVAGKADSVYVTYLDAGHLKVGFDHWGIGAASSAAVAVDYAVPHEFAIDLPSMHGQSGAHLTSTVALDGKVILSTDLGAHPASNPDIVFGANFVGASTSEPRFTGELTRIDFQGD